MTTLRTAKIVGFFSLPHASLAEHNPTAYNNAMAAAPEGAGSCSQCGMGILHHVVIVDETGTKRFIGTDCAEKIGCNAHQVRYRMTDEQIAKRDADRAAKVAEYERKRLIEKQEREERLARRYSFVGDIIEMLRGIGSGFHTSLADQLAERPLSRNQAYYVAKATSETGRRNKRNGTAWDEIFDRCMMADDEFEPESKLEEQAA